MIKKLSILICVALLSSLLLTGCSEESTEGNIYPEKIMDMVYDMGTCENLDFDSANEAIAEFLGSSDEDSGDEIKPSACSAIVKELDNGDMIVGRNMDYYISKYPVFTGKIDNPGQYKCSFVTVISGYIPKEKELESDGLTPTVYNAIPYIASDVMNEKGLYIEHNMRSDEEDENGESIFACDHTNPDSDLRISAASIPAYLCLNCSTVEEAVELAKSLDIYTLSFVGYKWASSYMIADAYGNYGVLEIGAGKVSFLEGQACQTNYYLTEEFAEKSQYGSGYGRYDYLTANIDEVESEEDMSELMSGVYYSKGYSVYNEDDEVDWRSENVSENTKFTAEYVLDDDNITEMKAMGVLWSVIYNCLPRDLMERLGLFWETRYTTIANCTEKTMTVQFFEQSDMVITIDTDE